MTYRLFAAFAVGNIKLPNINDYWSKENKFRRKVYSNRLEYVNESCRNFKKYMYSKRGHLEI